MDFQIECAAMQKLLAALLFLGGCQAVASGPATYQSADAKAERFWTAVTPYQNCTVTRAKRLSAKNEDPYYLAVAARSSCGREREAAINAIMVIYDRDIWPRMISMMDSRVEEAAIASIVTGRGKP